MKIAMKDYLYSNNKQQNTLENTSKRTYPYALNLYRVSNVV